MHLEVLDEDEQFVVWDRLIEAVHAIDAFSANELNHRIGKPICSWSSGVLTTARSVTLR
jgi:hypothetical protein